MTGESFTVDSQLEQLLLDLKAGRVSKEHVREVLSRRSASTAGAGPHPSNTPEEPRRELVSCHPVWEKAVDSAAVTGEQPGHMVVLIGPRELADSLRAHRGTLAVHLLESHAVGFAERYTDLARQLLSALRRLLADPSLPRTPLQLICPADGENALCSGLLAMVKSAALENPRIVPQLVLVDADVKTAIGQILQSRLHPGEQTVRFHNGARSVLTWEELPAGEETGYQHIWR